MSDYIHKEFPKSVGKKEFWKQIKRTINGVEVSENDINMIVEAIRNALKLNKEDHLLDLGCGNAALASKFFKDIKSYSGFDFSDYLLGIAKENFFLKGKTNFKLFDMRNDKINNCGLETVNKVLIYGTISYLSKSDVKSLISNLMSELKNIERIFIGNVPNINFSSEFFARRGLKPTQINDPNSPIGVWWDPDELAEIFMSSNLDVEIKNMPESFYGHKIRFDIIGKAKC